MTEAGTERVCPSCDRDETGTEFYAAGAECKPCKRLRSRRNRREQTRKIVLVERVVDLLARLAGRAATSDFSGEEAMLGTAPEVEATHPGRTIIGDKNYYGRKFENDLAQRHLQLLRPARKGEPERPGARANSSGGRAGKAPNTDH